MKSLLCSLTFLLVSSLSGFTADVPAWKIGEPIVHYWAGPGFPGGPALDDRMAAQLVEGGWNLAWCREPELPMAQRHALRGLLTDPLLDPAALEDPKRLEALTALVERVKSQPALYGYHLTDEPSAGAFPALGKLVAFLRERDPAHLAYINLLPVYANNEQFGVKGPQVEAYTGHLKQFVATVHPSLLSYDHYQFTRTTDEPRYFLNLAMMRDTALQAGVPFMNIVQACTWVPGAAASPHSPRIPNAEELRYLVYTTLGYGAQAISYYVYGFPGHEGGMVLSDGTPTALFAAAKALNREFVAIARELQPLKSLGVFHAGMQPPGVQPLPKDSTFTFDPPVPAVEYHPGERVQGVLLSQFGGANSAASHVLVVNLDYKAERNIGLKGPAALEVFDATTRQWSPAGGSRVELRLAGGSGQLVRVKP